MGKADFNEFDRTEFAGRRSGPLEASLRKHLRGSLEYVVKVERPNPIRLLN